MTRGPAYVGMQMMAIATACFHRNNTKARVFIHYLSSRHWGIWRRALLVIWAVLLTGLFLARSFDGQAWEATLARSLPSPEGVLIPIRAPDSATVVVFVDSRCAACLFHVDRYSQIHHAAVSAGAAFRIILSSDTGPSDQLRLKLAGYPLLIDGDFSVGQLLNVRAVPSLYILRRSTPQVVEGGPYAVLSDSVLTSLFESVFGRSSESEHTFGG